MCIGVCSVHTQFTHTHVAVGTGTGVVYAVVGVVRTVRTLCISLSFGVQPVGRISVNDV